MGSNQVKDSREEQQTKIMAGQIALSDSVTRLLATARNITELFEGIAAKLQKLVSLDWAAIGLSNELAGTLHILPLSRRVNCTWDLGETITLAGSPVAWLIEEKRALVESDLTKTSRFWTGVYLIKQGIRSVVYMPIFSFGRVMGGLLLGTRNPNAYGERELGLLKFVASQLAQPLENERLRHELEEKANKRAMTRELTKLISSSDDPERAIEAFGLQLKKIVPIDYICVRIVEGRQANLLASYSTVPAEALAQRVYPLRDSEVGWVVIHKQANVNADFSKDLAFPIDELFLKAGLQSGICLPLILQDEVFGALQLCSSKVNAYDQEKLQFLDDLAVEIAIPVKNIYLNTLIREGEAFAQAIIHELTAHLTPIMASSDTLAEQIGDKIDEAVLKLVQNVREGANLLNFNLSILRSLSKIRTTAIEQQINSVDIRAVAREVAVQLANVVQAKRQVLILEFPPAPLQVKANAASVHHLLLSLLGIASEVSPESAELTLAALTQRDSIVLQVRVFPKNFAIEDPDALLHAYERGEPDRQPYPGIALRLTVSRRCVERQGGRFWIEKSADTIVFCLSFPSA
jgi:GAF domain-containing protein